MPKKTTTILYRGFLREGSNGEETVLELSEDPARCGEILVVRIRPDIWHHGKYLTVRYYLAEKEIGADQIDQTFLQQLHGAGEADYGMRYSELTGYLWTTEELKVGGHDLIERLRGGIGKFLHLEITYSSSPKA